jgi:hypothetical protein
MGDRQRIPPVAVPAPGDRAARPAVTQVPPFGAPLPDDGNTRAAAVPPPPRVPAAVPTVRAFGAEKPKPKRRITSSEVDGLWATTTHSDEDDTIPRRARPSELAAAAAAAADATAALRDGRGRTRSETGAPRKPPPPLPPGARSAPRDPGDDGASAAKPPHKPPVLKSTPPPFPRTTTPGGLLAPVAPLGSVTAIGEPSKPAVRIRPPPPSGVSIEDLTSEIQPAPFKMGTQGSSPLSTTMTGVAPAPADKAAVEGSNKTPVPAPAPPVSMAAALKPPALPRATPPTAPAIALPEPTGGGLNKLTKTLVSPRDAIDSISGLAAAIAVADDPSDTAVLPSIHGAPAQPRPADEEVTESRPLPSSGPAQAESNGHVAHEGGPLPPLPTRASHSSRPPPLPPKRKVAPMGDPQRVPQTPPVLPVASPGTAGEVEATAPRAERAKPAEPLTAPFPTGKLAGDPGAADLAEPAGEAPGPQPDPRAALPSSDVSASMRPPGRLAEQVAVPLSSLVGAGGLLISLVIGSFFVGRASSVPTARLTAHPALAAVPVVARSTLAAPLRACWMVKQPARWAPQASRSIPFDAVATRSGTLAIGYAQDAREAMGIEVDVASGEVKSRLDDKAREEIERVVPTPAVEFRVARAGTGGALRSPIEVVDEGVSPLKAGAPEGPQAIFALGLGAGGIALASPPDGTPAALWPLDGEEGLGAATVRPAGERGFALVYRRGGSVWGGFVGADRKASGDLVKVMGSGGAVGKPAVAWNGREVAVTFADRPDSDGHYEIRVGHAAPGTIPSVTAVLPLPKGGPGGDAFAPELAGLSDGRWLLMWTEGGAGARAVRAQTLTPDFQPLGDPIALSPPAGNYGQGVIGVVGDRAATVFLSKGASSYELWGAVLQCGG